MSVCTVAGWLPEVNPPTSTVRDAAASLGLGVAPSEDWHMAEAIGPIYEQGFTPSCVSQAFAKGAAMLGGDRPSRRWLHRKVRQRDEGRPGYVPDSGTWISTVCAVSRDLGWTTERHHEWSDAWALTPDDTERNRWLDAEPGITASHHAHDQRNAIQEHAVTTDEETRAVLTAGYPIIFGMDVDDGFRRINTWTPYEVTGPSIGGHAMLAFGYDSTGVGIVNSWSSGWGVGGLWLMSWRCWRQQARDRRALQLIRRATT